MYWPFVGKKRIKAVICPLIFMAHYWRRELIHGKVEVNLFKQFDNKNTVNHNSIELAEMENNIAAAVNQLPDQCRRVFVMSREQELSHKEIAERLGISIKTVEAHITKALKFLREHLDYQLFWLMIWYWMK